MAVSGFEGFEKRLELHFSGDNQEVQMGLRELAIEYLEQVLHAVQCMVVSAVGNRFFDAYVLSESSLFVYPTKMIIKTCGTTQILKSISPLLHHARLLGLSLHSCRYTRGSFIFPKAQPFPHTSFTEEVVFIEQNLPATLCFRKSRVFPSGIPSHSWHVFTASHSEAQIFHKSREISGSFYTVEVCMTDIDRELAGKFYRRIDDGKTGDSAGKVMTKQTGIGDVIPGALVCDYAFDPCGYSMNGLAGDRYLTIHVTPEDGHSYASFECRGSVHEDPGDFVRMLRKAVQVFRPMMVSVSTTSASIVPRDTWAVVAVALEPLGLVCRSGSEEEFPAAGRIVFQTFTTRWK